MGVDMYVGLRDKKTKEVLDLFWWCGRGSVMDEAWRDGGLRESTGYATLTESKYKLVKEALELAISDLAEQMSDCERRKKDIGSLKVMNDKDAVSAVIETLDDCAESIAYSKQCLDIAQSALRDWTVIGDLRQRVKEHNDDVRSDPDGLNCNGKVTTEYEIVSLYSD